MENKRKLIYIKRRLFHHNAQENEAINAGKFGKKKKNEEILESRKTEKNENK